MENRSTDEEFRRPGRGDPKIRPVESRAGHGRGRLDELTTALDAAEQARSEVLTEEELRALGTVITLEGADAEYPLAIERLERMSRHRTTAKRPQWLLLSVRLAQPDIDLPERAMVWVSDQYRAQFLKIFEDYLQRSSPAGNPRNNELVANIARIRQTVLADLWQSDGQPPATGKHWWEIWLRPTADGPELLRRYAQTTELNHSPRVLRLIDRSVMWIEATWTQLEALPFTAVPVAEIRSPEFVDTIEDLSIEEQEEYLDDLLERLEPADEIAPAVCHLDTGVARTHVLLADSLAEPDLHTVLGVSGFDQEGHGTKMAGIALFGNLETTLAGSGAVVLRHRLESVRIMPHNGEPQHDRITYGDVTAQAVAVPETVSKRDRVFCMPISVKADNAEVPGQPTLWSATVDALAVGAEVVRNGDELELLSAPDPARARLLVVSAGNTDKSVADHLDLSDLSAVLDPGQAWNALTVGAHTELISAPTDPAYTGWEVLADEGELSPYSRTSLLFGTTPWPIKPDIVMEGGNVLYDGGSLFEPGLPALSTRTTGHVNNLALTSAHATSAATAQASRLAALAMATYPEYWPETIRALLVHGAEWTPAMRAALNEASKQGKKAQQAMLRRYGWGVPTEDRVLYSTDQAVTLVVQDEFLPFEGDDFKIPTFRLHDLPWPTQVLQDLGDLQVDLRVTLSYFIEPTASRRGWRRRYRYPSHQLRFEVQDPLESELQFVQRVNRDARTEEAGGRPDGGQVKWLVGAYQRNLGSLHQDVWPTSGVELAQSGKLAVFPVGGWWKNNNAKARVDQPVRYALVISLKTSAQGIDLYTPIANTLKIPTAITVE
ncbi:S8 family peptidase [Nocardioides terrisoli]|uniref:S8 family peptidase n=1 Tax=Nocardioides terrisoli TaxID=3388267 RepID=UPI00287B7D36|nr:S8 family peptidase [Nocardioides marmorisolisilvae]